MSKIKIKTKYSKIIVDDISFVNTPYGFDIHVKEDGHDHIFAIVDIKSHFDNTYGKGAADSISISAFRDFLINKMKHRTTTTHTYTEIDGNIINGNIQTGDSSIDICGNGNVVRGNVQIGNGNSMICTGDGCVISGVVQSGGSHIHTGNGVIIVNGKVVSAENNKTETIEFLDLKDYCKLGLVDVID